MVIYSNVTIDTLTNEVMRGDLPFNFFIQFFAFNFLHSVYIVLIFHSVFADQFKNSFSFFADSTGINAFSLWNVNLKSDSKGSKSLKIHSVLLIS